MNNNGIIDLFQNIHPRDLSNLKSKLFIHVDPSDAYWSGRVLPNQVYFLSFLIDAIVARLYV
jgi:hypothetical protein